MAKTTATKKSKVNSPLKDMIAADGNISQPETPKYRTIDELLGKREFSLYKTSDASEYEVFLRKMDIFDLQTHATECGIIPKSSRDRTIDTLMGLFTKEMKKRNLVPSQGVSAQKRGADRDRQPELMELLKRGR